MNILAVSACFLAKTRYDGQSQKNPKIYAFLKYLQENQVFLLPVCPEQLGGLPTPRPPAEIHGDQVINRDGEDVTTAFTRGAEITGDLLKMQQVSVAFLKQKSPSCGAGLVYSGDFSGRLVAGDGMTTSTLKRQGVTVYTEDDLENLDFVTKHFHLDVTPLQKVLKEWENLR